jgi:hypothetical protein
MGNGALPNGPSYRAHPRLYLNVIRRAAIFLVSLGCTAEKQGFRSGNRLSAFDPLSEIAERNCCIVGNANIRCRISFRQALHKKEGCTATCGAALQVWEETPAKKQKSCRVLKVISVAELGL